MATPAADPIIKILPPVPAQNANNSQKTLSAGYTSREYMPIAPATIGTLSIIDEKTPIKVFTT